MEAEAAAIMAVPGARHLVEVAAARAVPVETLPTSRTFSIGDAISFAVVFPVAAGPLSAA
ncbi:hypothetical protein D3C71_2172340 [compost metagenome]